ncbi:MAG: acyl-CoA dehydrogenase, partial [Flavobacteriales bacterium]
MNFEYSEKTKDLQNRVRLFMENHILPEEKAYQEFTKNNLWQVYPGMERLKGLAKAEGLWNLFLPEDYGELSAGLTNLEYAPLAELMGRVLW